MVVFFDLVFMELVLVLIGAAVGGPEFAANDALGTKPTGTAELEGIGILCGGWHVRSLFENTNQNYIYSRSYHLIYMC